MGGTGWNAHRVEQTLWAHFILNDNKKELLDDMPSADSPAATPTENGTTPSTDATHKNVSQLLFAQYFILTFITLFFYSFVLQVFMHNFVLTFFILSSKFSSSIYAQILSLIFLYRLLHLTDINNFFKQVPQLISNHVKYINW